MLHFGLSWLKQSGQAMQLSRSLMLLGYRNYMLQQPTSRCIIAESSLEFLYMLDGKLQHIITSTTTHTRGMSKCFSLTLSWFVISFSSLNPPRWAKDRKRGCFFFTIHHPFSMPGSDASGKENHIAILFI